MAWKAQIEKSCRAVDGVCGVAVKNMPDGDDFALNEKTVFPAASLIKLFILWELFRQVESRQIHLDNRMTLGAGQKVGGFGILKELHDGLDLTVLDLAKLMIILSDNVATNILIERLGMAKINAAIAGLGARDTKLQRKMMDQEAKERGLDNFTSVHDVTLLLDSLVTTGTLSLGPESVTGFIDILKGQQCNNKIPLLLPPGTVLAHKTGDLPGIEHDAGILFTSRGPVIIVVMTKDLTSNEEGIRLSNKIGRLVFEVIEPLDKFISVSDKQKPLKT